MFEMLRKAFDCRNEADYEIKPLPESSAVVQMLENEKYFIAQVEVYFPKA